MTRETFAPSPLYTISGTGPYPITHPYQVDTEIAVTIFQGTTIVDLALGSDFTVSPTSTETTGDVTLSSAIATTYAGASLLIRRETVADQGWAGQTAREKGLEAQLDALTQRMQEIDEALARAVKIPEGVIGELPLDLASQWLGFDASNNVMVGAGAVGLPTTPFAATLLDDPDAAAARATLGAGTGNGSMSNLVEDTTPQLGGTLDANGKSVFWSKGATVTAASELLVLTDGNSFDVSGSTTIATIENTADAFGIGSLILLKFNSALTLTHSASLSLLGQADITVAAGDTAIFQKIASGQWRMAAFSGISSTADWQAGTNTKPSMASAANISAAISALVPALYTKNHTTNGYRISPDGTIMQWASVVANSSGSLTFPIAFPHAVFAISVTSSSATTANGTDYYRNPTLTGIEYSTTGAGGRVFVIGY